MTDIAPPHKNTAYLALAVKWALSIALCAAALWVIGVAPDWSPYPQQLTQVQVLCLMALAVGLLEREAWQRMAALTRLPALALRLLIPALLVALAVVLTPAALTGRALVVLAFALFNLLLLALSLLLKDRRRAGLVNLAVSFVSLLLTLLVIELLAPTVTQAVASIQRQAALNNARAAATSPLDADQIAPQTTAPPVGASPQTEVLQQGGGPAWGEQTGWGTNTDTVLRYWMDGVYDNEIEYNSLGFRGAEIPYDKPDDVYRVMLVGDSFIEAREVTYEDTVYARLSDLLADAQTPDGKRIEVFGVGATGWGTLQAYLYYHVEGYRFEPDLIMHFFVINDVADNHPQQFYHDRGLDFVVTEDAVQLLRDGIAPEVAPVNPGERLLDALPAALAQSNTAALLRRLVAPPREAITLAGDLGGAHPQNYIFVREPDVEGYPEGWRRTEQAYEIWAREAQANHARLMVVAVDISVERITEISTYYPDEQDNWVWDVDLPYTRLGEILTPLDVPLLLTRQYYAAYADSVDQRPYEALFYPQDGHWNPTGHRVTAELIASYLHDTGLVQAR